MTQKMTSNDLEVQSQKNNLKLIRQVRFERCANDCIQAISSFKEVFFECYIQTELTKSLFECAEKNMKALASLMPKVSKKHDK